MFVCQRCRVLRWDLAPTPTSKTQHRTLTPPNAASGRQPPLTRGPGALSQQKGRASGQSLARCLRTRVPMGGTRNRERPCHAASSVPHSPATPPNAASGRQPPLTRGRRPLPLAAKGSSERAESRCPCAPGWSPPICSILCQDGHVLTIKIYLKICGRPSKFADQNLRCGAAVARIETCTLAKLAVFAHGPSGHCCS